MRAPYNNDDLVAFQKSIIDSCNLICNKAVTKGKMDARGLKSLATSIILQIIFFWALQEKGLLDENQDYMVSKFFEIQNATYDPTISDFYSFL
ncbi:MAG: hypothetical protein ACTSXP_05025, partial [Promethearchaeota archaeon]